MRSSIPCKARWHRFMGVAGAVLLSTVSLAAATAERTGVLILKNGDHITGEIKKLERGMLEFKTDHMDTLQVEWPAVARLTSKTHFEVELEGGRRIYGSLAPDAEEGRVEVVGT